MSSAQFQQFGPFFDGGVFVTGAKLYACAAGTTTQKAVWYDQAMTTTAPFPMVANANGQIVGFFDGLYKIVIARSSSTGPADNVLEVWDNYNVAVDGSIIATGSTEPRLISDHFGDRLSVKDFGAIGDGVTDDTSAIQAALTTLGDDTSLYFPPGTYLLVSGLTVSANRVHLQGAGMYATTLLYRPTANGTALTISAGASIINQGSVSDLALYSNDASYTKLGIDLVDAVGYRLENIVIGGSVVAGSATYWSGGTGSIGLQVRGRDSGKIRNLFIAADKPLAIADNPNSTIDIDHFHFSDLTLIANGYAVVKIEDGVNLTNVTFDGYNAWVLGTHGFYWADTTTTVVSNNLILKGVRTEQGTDATAYSFYISHNYVLENLHIEDCYPDAFRKGFYLRKVKNTLIETTNYGGTLEAFNFVGATQQLLTFQNCFFQVGSTAVLTNWYLYDAMPDIEANKPIPNSAVYIYGTGYQATQRRRMPIIVTGSLPAAGAGEDGSIVIEDNGAGDRNLIIYAGGQRFRIDGGAAV